MGLAFPAKDPSLGQNAAGEVEMSRRDEVVQFWLGLDSKSWFEVNPVLDQQIRAQFMDLWEAVWEGGLRDWQADPQGMLAYLIVADQFPRNMFRGDARSFATDDRARAAARSAVLSGFDMQVDDASREFFYLPFTHAESMGDQDWSVDLHAARVLGASSLLHAKAHREVIRRYARFPYRNAALGRTTTEAEAEFLAAGGYGSILKELAG